ncbi:HAD family hydrolase [Pontiella agarivorans]|uniref:phosphoglycolate phosphatase n=1 Tax=Pontiella agarivorans TaxID=3038953 RepID=A0ABU5MSM0_9BACT|nr:HAD-IA family hydrolase [Pontiella agarivorans]MDZ8117200.1 HAD-IA family hydrolase [Pontiella agarivorans]
MESQLIIFDLDGTLIDARGDLTAAVNRMRKHFGLGPLDFETVSSYIGNGMAKLVERSLQDSDIPLDDAMSIYPGFYYEDLTTHTVLYDGVKQGIPELVQSGHRVALLTNKPGGPSRAILEHFGLSEFFTAIIGGGDVPNLKPEPDGIFRCLECSGMEKARVWMVGDHYTDLAVAENAGVRSALVEYGFGEARGYKPDAQFASFPELVGYFV